MLHPRRENIAAVFGSSQGSGYLLTPWLVLTAAHLLGSEPPSAIVPGRTTPVACRVVWWRHDADIDAALLVAEDDLTPPSDREPGWIRIEDLAPRLHACAIGYPRAQNWPQGPLDSEQLTGTLKPGS